MKLTQLKLKNFRGYRNNTVIDFNDLTAFIGKNDAGKSTILEALEIFFNDTIVSIDKDDLCKQALAAGENKVEITCTFSELPNLVIDAAHPTSLLAEHLLNADGKLEIKKVFACNVLKVKEQVFIMANHPSTAGCEDLHQLKIDKLKARAVSLGVPVANYSANISSSIRSAIWNHVGNLNPLMTELPIDKEDGKRIWEVLETWMPVYALFQSDRKSKEDDKEVIDPMKVAINEALQEVAPQLQEIQKKVHEKAVEVAERTLQKLKEMNPALANELKPDFKTDPKWSSIFSLTLSSDDNIPINKRGSGVRRLIVLNFFRAEAERRRQQANNPSIIFAFEEPETSQHPDHQTMLVQAFKDLASANNTQVILTTHTPAVGGMLENDDLRFITTDAANTVVVEHGTAGTYEKIAKTLGVLPDPLASQVQLIVCVEGPNDISFLKNITPLVRNVDQAAPDILNDPRIAVIPLGGGTLKDWVNQNYLSGLNKPEFHIYDRDDAANPPYLAYANNVNARGGNHHAVLTTKREMENYIHHDAINRALGITIAAYGAFDDVPELVAEALNIKNGGAAWAAMNPEKKGQKVSKAKKNLNVQAVTAMTNAEFVTIDPTNEIVQWFQLIAARLV